MMKEGAHNVKAEKYGGNSGFRVCDDRGIGAPD